MCIRFVYRGRDLITGFNFDIDPAQWDHRILQREDCFSIGILRPDGRRHCYHGVNRNGNVGTLLYVHGNPAGAYRAEEGWMTVADLTEAFVLGQLTWEGALEVLQTKRITYAPDATMQAMLSDKSGRTLLVEPGFGFREERGRFSLLANGSLLEPESTRPFALPGDDRYERAAQRLASFGQAFTVADALETLEGVRQEGMWATRVSFVYSAGEQAVYFVQNNRFDQVERFAFPAL